MPFNEQFLRSSLAEVQILYNTFPQEATFSVDTRTLRAGDIFVALTGKNSDGHLFIEDALKKGASGIIIETKQQHRLDRLRDQLSRIAVVAVPDTLQALIQLATAWRLLFSYPVVAITGSVGKTSTKEMVANILRVSGRNFLASYANQNTMIGLALNILRMRAHHEVAIFEVGVSKRGEMAQLAQMLKPQTALITNICHSHMEGLGSLADIALEKRDIFKFFNEDSIGIVNGDQSIISQVGYLHPVIRFGAKTINQIQARKVDLIDGQASFVLKIYKEKHKVVLKQAHEGAVFNALAAVALSNLLGISVPHIMHGIQEFTGVKRRFEKKTLPGNKGGFLIDDCFNASPESMKIALLAFQNIESKGEKIAVLGDMFELGVHSQFWHRQLGRFLRKVPSLNRVILVGDFVKYTYKTVPVGIAAEVVATWQEAVDRLKNTIGSDSVILVKGSHGMQLDKLVSAFT